jgi:hypothetical protein
MNHRIVLDVDFISQTNKMDIPSNYGIEPNTAVVSHYDISYDGGIRS